MREMDKYQSESLKETLRKQFELLAERSRICDDASLAPITNSMLNIYSVLSESSDSSIL